MIRRIAWLGLLCLGTSSAWAIPEQGFEQTYHQAVEPYLQTATSGTFSGAENIPIHYYAFENANERAALVIIPGRTEPALRYAELAYDFRDLGFSIYIIDHRGQGLSGRMTTNSHVGYVDHFDNYVLDLEKFMSQIVRERRHARTFMVAHSMGGAIASLYLERNPGQVDAAVFSAPMLEIETGKFPKPMAFAIVSMLTAVGKGADFSVGQKDWNPKSDFSTSKITRSPERFAAFQSLFRKNPETIIGGASNRWVLESMKATKRAVKDAGKVTTPVLLFQAGNDLIVRPKGQDKFCSKARSCQKITFSGSYHEILMERDLIRDHALLEISRFFESFL